MSNRHVTFRNALRKALSNIGAKLSAIEGDLDQLNDLEILYQLEQSWPMVTNVKSFANFIKHDLGLGKDGRKVIVLVDSSDIVLDVLKVCLKEIGGLHLVTTAKTYHEGLALAKYYASIKSLAAIITDIFINSYDVSTSIYDPETSGINLVREARGTAKAFEQDIYCIVTASDYIDFASVEDGKFYHELTGEVVQVADIYVPKKSIKNALSTLIKSNFGKE